MAEATPLMFDNVDDYGFAGWLAGETVSVGGALEAEVWRRDFRQLDLEHAAVPPGQGADAIGRSRRR